jgi:enamine deaminase RidA (YjgF/YER057c/UK114 family)
MTAAGAAAATGSAQAQAGANVRHSNPSGMTQPTAYSQIVEVNGPHRLIFVAGQTGVDTSGKATKEFRAQAVQAFENIKTALASVGGNMDNVVRLVTYLTDIEQNAEAYREVRASFFANRGALPASTLLQITRLADPSYHRGGRNCNPAATRVTLVIFVVSRREAVNRARLWVPRSSQPLCPSR